MIVANRLPRARHQTDDNHIAPQAAPVRRLDGAEWEIIEMARWDGPSSINPRSLPARIASIVFGHDTPLPLADPGLEALRRFSVRAWFWKTIRNADWRALLEAGYSAADARRILAHVARHRRFMPSVEYSTD